MIINWNIRAYRHTKNQSKPYYWGHRSFEAVFYYLKKKLKQGSTVEFPDDPLFPVPTHCPKLTLALVPDVSRLGSFSFPASIWSTRRPQIPSKFIHIFQKLDFGRASTLRSGRNPRSVWWVGLRRPFVGSSPPSPLRRPILWWAACHALGRPAKGWPRRVNAGSWVSL
jgi:hypothetical protein